MIELLSRLGQAVPRYTSYPPATEFVDDIPRSFVAEVQKKIQGPLSVYVHIPFCRTMCLFCGCSVVLSRSKEKEAIYVEALLEEIEASSIQGSLHQLHLGGGTPTHLTSFQLEQIVSLIYRKWPAAADREFSIEVDPRTVFADGGEKLEALSLMGFNRVSFGIQDLDEEVQEAVLRRQSKEMTFFTLEKAKSLFPAGINVDLIYGLPKQTLASFEKTVSEIASFRPDRIALFSYAHVPWLKKHQQALSDLPPPADKLALYVKAKKILLEAGYLSIGMDHFALPSDRLAAAFLTKTLSRNFQGYSATLAPNLAAFGLSAISSFDGLYVQNEKEMAAYLGPKKHFVRGFILGEKEKAVKRVIDRWMCDFAVEEELIASYLLTPRVQLLIDEGLIVKRGSCWEATEMGQLLIRNIAASFDPLFVAKEQKHAGAL